MSLIPGLILWSVWLRAGDDGRPHRHCDPLLRPSDARIVRGARAGARLGRFRSVPLLSRAARPLVLRCARGHGALGEPARQRRAGAGRRRSASTRSARSTAVCAPCGAIATLSCCRWSRWRPARRHWVGGYPPSRSRSSAVPSGITSSNGSRRASATPRFCSVPSHWHSRSSSAAQRRCCDTSARHWWPPCSSPQRSARSATSPSSRSPRRRWRLWVCEPACRGCAISTTVSGRWFRLQRYWHAWRSFFRAVGMVRVRAKEPPRLPFAAIAQIGALGGDHNLFCEDFTWCSVALAYPGLHVFIDGRCDAYPLPVWREYASALNAAGAELERAADALRRRRRRRQGRQPFRARIGHQRAVEAFVREIAGSPSIAVRERAAGSARRRHRRTRRDPACGRR